MIKKNDICISMDLVCVAAQRHKLFLKSRTAVKG